MPEPTGSGLGWRNPFRAIRNLAPSRIDQGVDYGGTGPVYALGPGRIINTTNTGWPGGGFIAERLAGTDRIVYTAEDITPAVHVGQKVDSETVIGHMFGPIETGWAAPPPELGESLARQQGETSFPTAEGESFNQVLVSLGVPSGTGGPATSGPVSALEIYQLLRAKGLTTVQAIGIMANMFYESRLDPESGGTDSNGKWAGGLISWNTGSYPNAHSLVTGKPQTDVRAQIDYLVTQTGGFQQGIKGANPADVAGNFAEHVEGCASCQPGGQQWAARRAQATVIAGWVHTGKWPLTGVGSGLHGSLGGGGGCLIKGPSFGPFGGGCLLSKSNARGIIGAGMIAAAIPVGLVGAVVLAAFAFRRAAPAIGKTTEAVGGAVALIPGAEPAGAAIAAAGSLEARKARTRENERKQGQADKAAAKKQRADDAQARHDESEYRKVQQRTGRASSRQAPPDGDVPPF